MEIHMPTGKNIFIRMENRKWFFLMLIHLPQRLIGFLEKGQDDQEISKSMSTYFYAE